MSDPTAAVPDTASLQMQISIKTLRKSLDAAEQQGDAAVKLLEQAAEIARQGNPSAAPARGIDLQA